MLLVAILGVIALGAAINLALPASLNKQARVVSFASLVAGLALTVTALVQSLQGAPLAFSVPWFVSLDASFGLFADGPAWALLLMGFLVGLGALGLSVYESREREGLYQANLLLALLGAQGCFVAADALTFFAFFELMLIPGWFIVRAAGSEAARIAALRFFLFTQAGGLALLLGSLGIAAAGDSPAFVWSAFASSPAAPWLAVLIVLGLGVKLPLVPLHSWLADAYTFAPTSATIVFAGLLSKAGAFGLWRMQPVIRDSLYATDILVICGIIGIFYGALLAFSSTDFKRLIAYSSMSHLGYIAVAIAAGTPTAMQGALLLMLAHGLTVTGFFAVIGLLRDRIDTTDLSRMGGLWNSAPQAAFFGIVFAFATMGIPGFLGFAGEAISLLGTFTVWPHLAGIAQLGVLGATLYATSATHRAFMGPTGTTQASGDLRPFETASLALLLAVILLFGCWPQPLLTLFAAN